jgi:carbonic anhydrase/acetyltransferase-like protein (isoleucine patch superfamily)
MFKIKNIFIFKGEKMIVEYKGINPVISDSVFLVGESFLAGDVTIYNYASIWPGVVARGDVDSISIGEFTNIQDNSVLHCNAGQPLEVGKYVTVGHATNLHGCKIGNNVLIGIGAIILNGAVIPDNVIVAAGSLVPENKVLESGKMYMGVPVKPTRDLTTEEIESIKESALHYIELAKEFTRYSK